ncbi:MAG: hypothetical protein JWL86_6340 [Rhizobium sp.]|nr:hypothetical protein [Rhizobium sp.]
MSGLRERLLGGWRLADWGLTDGDEEDKFLPPLGLVEDCSGFLIYSPSGVMSAMLSRRNRPLFVDSSLDGGTVQERAAAFATIVSYAGTFEIDEAASEVTHVVECATAPHFVGQRMRRICIFEGNRLKLDTPSMIIGGVSRVSYIAWEKV